MKRCANLLIAVVGMLIGLANSPQARILTVPTYQQLFDSADLVVIARPMAKTSDTGETATLPNFSAITVHGVQTEFKIVAVLKGDKSAGGQLVLHHFRESHDMRAPNGPTFVAFDPADRDQRRAFLMFLVREKDGRFAPAGGQLDAGYRSIGPLPTD